MISPTWFFCGFSSCVDSDDKVGKSSFSLDGDVDAWSPGGDLLGASEATLRLLSLLSLSLLLLSPTLKMG